MATTTTRRNPLANVKSVTLADDTNALVAAKSQITTKYPLSFDYTVLDEHVRDEAAENTVAILTKVDQVGQHIYDIGLALIRQKEILGHGYWLPWLQEELKWDERRAQLMMSIPQRWPDRTEYAPIAMFGQSVQQLLAAPSTPPEATTKLIEAHNAGQSITVTAAKQMIAATKPVTVGEHTRNVVVGQKGPTNFVGGSGIVLSLNDTIGILRQALINESLIGVRAASFLRRARTVDFVGLIPTGHVLDGETFEKAISFLCVEIERMLEEQRAAAASEATVVYTSETEQDMTPMLKLRVRNAITAMLAKATVADDIDSLVVAGVLTEDMLNGYHTGVATLREIVNALGD